MIRIVRAPVAASVQDRGRTGHRSEGHAQSGAMDPASLAVANALAGAAESCAGVELGPGPCVIEVTEPGTIAFGGAHRDGAPWWETIDARPGTVFELSTPRDGVWSYLALAGGVDAPVVAGSRSSSVREGIGAWLTNGDLLGQGTDFAPVVPADPVPMRGAVRLFGELPGPWRVGTRIDRMGYALDGEPLRSGTASEWSEPLLPGFVQVPPDGAPIVLMTEGLTVGGYPVAAVVHSEDLRLIAQSQPGTPVDFIPAEPDPRAWSRTG
jgi:allophanate hydrolase subunit 2